MPKEIDLKLFEKTPDLPNIPSSLNGIAENKICLTNRAQGEWEFLFCEIEHIPSPYCDNQDFDFSSVGSAEWQGVIAPCSLIMQGFDIQNNKEYYYRKTVKVPKAYQNKGLHLRLEGVYSNARVWVNGKYIKTHIGGFTVWDCDLSEFSYLREFQLIIGIADIEGTEKGTWNKQGEKLGNSSWASFYAHHNICGILRNITLYSLPQTYVSSIKTETILCENNNAARFKIGFNVHGTSEHCSIELKLFNSENEVVAEKAEKPAQKVKQEIFSFTPSEKWIRKNKKSYENDCKCQKLYICENATKCETDHLLCVNTELKIQNPVLWDAEHPNLYTLEISVLENDEVVSKSSLNIGVREILFGGKNSTDKNKLYINGSEIKLRGVCRHDVSHLYGRSLTYGDMYDEIAAYKRNNINHIRSSHYPPDDELLNICDRLGIYVECENSACFKGANDVEINNAPQDFLDTYCEMLESARNHPSVIIWSLANESGFEKSCAFRAEYEYSKIADTSRPVIFSYPHLVHSKPLPYDIRSKHYKKVTSNLGRKDIPLLHDEFAHVACYNKDKLKTGDGCRAFWGESIKKGWDSIFSTDGALGCAIWAAIDDVFFLPEGTSERHQTHRTGTAAGYGEWGSVLDAFKREKPEAYLTKKAFNPFYIENINIKPNGITLKVYNRFDHTNINEGQYVCYSEKGSEIYRNNITAEIAPHKKGKIVILGYPSETQKISFIYSEFEAESIIIQNKKAEQTSAANQKPLELLNEFTHNFLMIKNDDLNFLLKTEFEFDGKAPKIKIKEISKNNLKADINFGRDVIFYIIIKAINESLNFVIKPKTVKAKISTGNNFKVKLCLNETVGSISWQKNSLYSIYPKNHIDRPTGIAERFPNNSPHPVAYGEKPMCDWSEDTENYFLYEKDSPENFTASRDFRTMRTRVKAFTADMPRQKNLKIQMNSENNAVHMLTASGKDDVISISKGAYFPDLQWGNYFGKVFAFSRNDNQFAFTISLNQKQEDRNE